MLHVSVLISLLEFDKGNELNGEFRKLIDLALIVETFSLIFIFLQLKIKHQ